jgi:hypothetical protein
MGLALLLLLVQHWGMMLSNSDDPWIVRSSFQHVLDTASVQGRFWLIPINLLAQIPYLSDSWGVANTLKMGVNGLVMLGFVMFCARLTNVRTGTLMGLVWLALIDVSPGYYSPFHGFLMMFNLQFAALFFSFYVYLGRLNPGAARATIVWPFALYGFAMLAYEPMFFYSLAFPAMFLYKHLQSRQGAMQTFDWWQLAVSFTRRNYPLALVLLTYVVCYFGYRYFQPAEGRGLDSTGDLRSVFLTIYKFSIHGFHVQFKPLGNVIPTVSTDWNVGLALVYAGLIAVAMLLLVPRLEPADYPQQLYSKPALAILLFFVFCPNILLAFVAAYRQWAAEDPHYVGNYFSSFALAILLTLGLFHLVGGQRAKRERVLFGAVLFLFFSSACDNYVRWSNLAETNRKDSVLWEQGIAHLKTLQIYEASPLICAENAPEKVSGDDRYWSSMLSQILNRPLTYSSKHPKPGACTYTLDFNTWRFPDVPH